MSPYKGPGVSDQVRSADGPFAIVPATLLGDQRVNDRAARVYSVIASFADRVTNETFAAQQTFADRMNVSVKTVQRGMQDLMELGWLSSVPRIVRGRKVGNLYTVHGRPQSDTRKDRSVPDESDTFVSAEATDLVDSDATHDVASLLSDHEQTISDRDPDPNCVQCRGEGEFSAGQSRSVVRESGKVEQHPFKRRCPCTEREAV